MLVVLNSFCKGHWSLYIMLLAPMTFWLWKVIFKKSNQTCRLAATALGLLVVSPLMLLLTVKWATTLIQLVYISLLYPSLLIELHIRITVELHQSFICTQFISFIALFIVAQILLRLLPKTVATTRRSLLFIGVLSTTCVKGFHIIHLKVSIVL